MNVMFRALVVGCGIVVGTLLGSIVQANEEDSSAVQMRECFGMESYSFWKLKVEGRNLELSTPTPISVRLRLGKKEHHYSNGTIVEVLRAVNHVTKKTALAVIRTNPDCRDGISNTEYASDIVFVDSLNTRVGCCDPVRK